MYTVLKKKKKKNSVAMFLLFCLKAACFCVAGTEPCDAEGSVMKGGIGTLLFQMPSLPPWVYLLPGAIPAPTSPSQSDRPSGGGGDILKQKSTCHFYSQKCQSSGINGDSEGSGMCFVPVLIFSVYFICQSYFQVVRAFSPNNVVSWA